MATETTVKGLKEVLKKKEQRRRHFLASDQWMWLYITMAPTERVIIPKWLRDEAMRWKQKKGFTNRQIQARLAEIGLNVSLERIAGWFSHARHVRNVLRNL